MQSKIKSLSQLKEIVFRLKSEGRQIVFTNGCFDLLHVGHTRYLAQAKAQGDVLIVALNSDSSVRSIKGDLRPLLPQDERAELLAALEMVDYVVIFDESDPYNVIKELQPNVLVKGGDWSLDKIIGRDIVDAAGGRVERIQVVDGASTTNIIKKIVSLYGGRNE